jgi:hypothetical protein
VIREGPGGADGGGKEVACELMKSRVVGRFAGGRRRKGEKAGLRAQRFSKADSDSSSRKRRSRRQIFKSKISGQDEEKPSLA